MLREVCDACGEIIDGPLVKREEPDATLLMGDEVVLMYDALCQTCKTELELAVRGFKNGKRHKVPVENRTSVDVTPPEATEEPKVVPKDVLCETAPQITPEPRKPVDKDSLPNQVTKQFPIKLPEHRTREA